MGKNEKAPVVIDGVEYDFNVMTDQQKLMVNHITDLDRKLSAARFNVDQMQVGRDAFFSMLKQNLEVDKEKVAA